MAVIRREPHANVSDSVAGAETVFDWGRYTWMYPWIALGATTAAVGYLIYTRSRQDVTTDSARLAGAPGAVEPVTGPEAKGEERLGTLVQKLVHTAGGVLLPVALRAGQNYMLHWLERGDSSSAAGRAVRSPSAGDWRGRTGQPAASES
jgi:hypothetical protein